MNPKHNGKPMFVHTEEVEPDGHGEFLSAPGEVTLSEIIVMDEEDAARKADRDAALKYLAHMKGAFASIYTFQGPRLFALDCMVAAHGMWEILGVRDYARLAQKWNCSKWNVGKLVKEMQQNLSLPPTASQREEPARANMREKRKKQLKKTSSTTNGKNESHREH